MSKLQKLMRFSIAPVALVAIAAMLPVELHAQTFFGSVVGTVSDASGAVIPGASVTITNLGTNESQNDKTGAAGQYQFVSLVPANYKVTVQAGSYKTFVRQPVTVAVDAVVRIDAALQLGAVTETVEVDTATPLLQTDSATLGAEVAGNTVQQMPLNGRNVLSLMELVPGVVPQGQTLATAYNNNPGGGTTPETWGNFQIGGGITGQNAQYYDGVTVDIISNSIGVIPTQDAVEEFALQTNDVSPEFGDFSGGVMEMTSKSGTNAWHGSAYEYFRNNVLNGNSFFNNENGEPRQQYNLNQFGVVASGPAIKDRLFGFFSWEHFSSRIGIPTTTNVPTAAMQAGYLPENLTTNSLVKALCPSATYNTSTQYPNTTYIPSTCWDVTATAMKGIFPQPDTSNAIGKGNLFTVPGTGTNADQYNGRADWVISPKQRLFARYTWWHLPLIPRSIFAGYGGFLSGFNLQDDVISQGVLGDTYTFNSSTVLDVRLGALRYSNEEPAANGGDLNMAAFGPGWAALGPQMSYREYPVPTLSGAYGIYNLHAIDFDNSNYYTNFSIAASLTKIIGRHTLKFGTEERLRAEVDSGITPNPDGGGNFTFDRSFIPDEWAAFLLGYPTSATIETFVPRGAYAYSQAYYLHDTWQTSRKLTLSLGLRWEEPEVFAERQNKATVLLPTTTDPYTGVTGTLALTDSSLYSPRGTQQMSLDHFQPRVGFAYRLTNNTAIHGGYGLVFVPADGGGAVPITSLVDQALTSLTNTGSTTTYSAYGNPWPHGINQPLGRSNPSFMTKYASSTAYLGQTVSGPFPGNPYGYNQQWNLTVGQQMKGDWMVEVGYVGAKGTHLPQMGDGVGALYWSIDELGSQYYSALNTTLAGFGSSPTSAQITSLINQGQSERPYPAYLGLQDQNKDNGASFYNALQVRMEKRFRSGGVLGASYSWSKFLSNTDTLIEGGDPHVNGGNAQGNGEIQDFNNPKGEYSILSYDIPQRLVIDYVLNLPFGQGQMFGANTHGFVRSAISGWGVNGITTFAGGEPAFLSTATGNYLTQDWGAGTLRPNYTAGCAKMVGGSWYQRYKNNNEAYNTSCFSQPGKIQFGNEPRVDGAMRSQGIDNFDFAASKTTPLHEQLNLVFRAEFFNIFNHPQFEPPSMIFGNEFGEILAQDNLPREIQFSLRLNY